MVQAPVNYMVDMPNAFVEGLKGYQLSQNVMAQNQQMQAQQAMQQRRDQMSSDMAAFANRQGKTKEDYRRMMEMYPELKDQMTAAISNMNEEQKNAKVNQMMPIYAALKAGNTDAARESMKNLENAYRSSGMDLEANNLKMLQDNLDIDPKGALASTEIFLFNADPEKFSKWMQQSKAMTGSKAQPVGGGIIIEDPVTKQKKLVTGSFQDGQLSIAGADLPGQLVSRLGETAAQQSERTVQETQQKVQAKSEEERAQGFVNQGLSAAESLPTLKRSLELLDIVKTGGFNKALIGAKQFFGIEGADEGELSYNLSKNVLSQLRTTFGAAFTENEGARLQKIEAGLGRNPATNKAILNNAIKMAKRKVNKAIMIAKKKGDEETVSELKDLMNFTLSPNETKPPPPPTVEKANPIQVQTGEQTATNPQTGEKIVFRNGQWLNINTGAPIQ